MRLGCDAGVWIDTALDLPGVHLIPIEPAIAIDSVRLSGSFTPTRPIGFIVATARNCGAQLLTADGAILKYAAGSHVRVIDASR